jgi:hypothetical protein
MSQKPLHELIAGPESPHFSIEGDAPQRVSAWTEIEEGRFMPRRVRGSCQGRALG